VFQVVRVLMVLRPGDVIEELLDGRDDLAQHGKPARHEHPVIGAVDLDDISG
jgi:hypothetical protein